MSSTVVSCNTASLNIYVPTPINPWDINKVKHIYRRLGFSASQQEFDTALNLAPEQLIDNLVDNAFNLPLTETPYWGYWSYSDFNDFESENQDFLNLWHVKYAQNFLNEGLRGRMVLFWLNHFVTELDVYFLAPYLFQYTHTAEKNAVGNFKTIVSEMGLTPAMLIYLNGFDNTNVSPNENYARELYELFTLGEGNGYSEDDITETAKALTGYNHWDDYGGEIYFDQSTFFDGPKTIFDQTGNWGYDDVINILFAEKQQLIAQFICEKLYKYFVSPEVDQDITTNIIQPLAQTLINENFELVPMLKQLFKSEHFFDEKASGVIVKSPLDLILNFINETQFPYSNQLLDVILYYAGALGQILFQPPDVAGWQGDTDWISTATMTGRWQTMEAYLWVVYSNDQQEAFRNLAKDLSNNSNDPAFITQVIIDFFNAKELFTPTDYDVATTIFKWDIPQNYYDDGLWNLDWGEAPWQVFLLLRHMATLPEFQLK